MDGLVVASRSYFTVFLLWFSCEDIFSTCYREPTASFFGYMWVVSLERSFYFGCGCFFIFMCPRTVTDEVSLVQSKHFNHSFDRGFISKSNRYPHRRRNSDVSTGTRLRTAWSMLSIRHCVQADSVVFQHLIEEYSNRSVTLAAHLY